jgi:hypothetical protein
VGGLPQIRPRTEIRPDLQPMPSMANADLPTSGRTKPQPPANPASKYPVNGKKAAR